MRRNRLIISAALTTALALAGSSVAVMAQDDEEVMQSLTGTVVVVVDEDGVATYFLQVDDETQVLLSVGPPWYWGDEDPLGSLVDGAVVTVEGYYDEDLDEAVELGEGEVAEEPVFEVRVIGVESLWDGDVPPWAGGPEVVGEVHPGWEGWSKGPGALEDDEVAASMAEARRGGPKVHGASHPGYKGWSKNQETRDAKGGNGEAGQARAEAHRGGPKLGDETHPGHQGWSKGQAAREAKGGPEGEDGRGRP
jgi:hypothetical protein